MLNLPKLLCRFRQTKPIKNLKPSSLTHSFNSNFQFNTQSFTLISSKIQRQRSFTNTLKYRFCTNSSPGSGNDNPQKSSYPFSQENMMFSTLQGYQAWTNGVNEYYNDDAELALALFEEAMAYEPTNKALLFKISRYLNTQGRLDEYHAILQKIIDLSTDKAEIIHLKKIRWSIYFIQGNQQKRKEIEAELLSLDESVAQFFEDQHQSMCQMADPAFFKVTLASMKGELFIKLNKISEAIKYYEIILKEVDNIKDVKNRTKWVQQIEKLFQMYQREGRHEEIEACLVKIQELIGYVQQKIPDFLNHKLKGAFAFYRQQYKQAVKHLKQFISQCQDSSIRLLIIKSHFELKQYNNAIKEAQNYFQKHEQQNTHQVREIYKTLAESYYAIQKYEQAIVCADYLIENSLNVINFLIRAKNYLELKNYKKAIEDYTHVVKLSTPEERIYSLAVGSRAYCYMNSNEYELAIQDYTTVIDNNTPMFSLQREHFYNRAQCFARLQKWKEAAQDHERVNQLAPSEHEALVVAACYLKTDEQKKGIETIKQLMKGIKSGRSTLAQEDKQFVEAIMAQYKPK